MANGNKLYSAYKGAARASSSYQASLYDVANIGAERQTSASLADIKSTDRNRMVGMISEGLDLAGNVIRRGQRREEMGKAAESLGAKPKERSMWDKLTGAEQMYEKVGEGGEMGVVSGSDIMAEYKLQQQEAAFGRSNVVNEDTGKVESTPAKELPTVEETPKETLKETDIPEYLQKNQSLADEVSTNIEKENTEIFNPVPETLRTENSDVPFYLRYPTPERKKDPAEIGPRRAGGLPIVNY